MKTCIAFIIMMFATLSDTVSAQPVATVIKTQAIEMGKALVNNDMVTFKKYMHPDLIAAGGGEEKLTVMADSAILLFKSMGGTVNKIFFGNPGEIISFKNELQTSLPQTIYLSTVFADVEFQSTLLAVSKDGGKNWYFIDTSLFKESDLRKKLPDISPSIEIPPVSKPKITPKAKANG